MHQHIQKLEEEFKYYGLLCIRLQLIYMHTKDKFQKILYKKLRRQLHKLVKLQSLFSVKGLITEQQMIRKKQSITSKMREIVLKFNAVSKDEVEVITID